MSTLIQDVVKKIDRNQVDQFTSEEKEFYDRMMFTDDVIRLHGPGKRARLLIMARFNVVPATANNYMQQCQSLIGSTYFNDKKYWKSWAIESLVSMKSALEKKLFQVDEETQEVKFELNESADPKLIKEYREIIAEIRATIGYDEDDPINEIPPAPEVVTVTGDPEKIGLKPVKISLEELRAKYGMKK